MLRIERVALDECDWEAMDAMDDRVVFQSRPWIEFLAESQGAEPVVAAVFDGSTRVGWFSGLVVRRYGIRILGSPVPGWTTGYMGFNLAAGVPRREAVSALAQFAFGPMRCLHVELRDRHATPADLEGLGFHVEPFTTYEVDLARTEDDVFAGMNSACRRCVRKAEKSGVVIEEAAVDGFCEDYHAQLEEVFAKQGLRPTYDLARVRSLVDHLHPSGRLLLLRARDPDGASIATALFPALGRTMYFWGGASRGAGQHLRPNEALFWHAIRHWMARGVTAFDLGGGGDYKRKYGGVEITVPHAARSRFGLLWRGREWMRRRNDPDNPDGRFRTPRGAPAGRGEGSPSQQPAGAAADTAENGAP